MLQRVSNLRTLLFDLPQALKQHIRKRFEARILVVLKFDHFAMIGIDHLDSLQCITNFGREVINDLTSQ